MNMFNIFKERSPASPEGEGSPLSREERVAGDIRAAATQTCDLMEAVYEQNKRLEALREEIAQSDLNDSQKMVCDKGLQEAHDILADAATDATRATKRVLRLRDQVESGWW